MTRTTPKHIASPVRVGDRLRVRVDDLAAGGDAVARHEGLAIFVPLALPGDHLLVEVVEVKPRYARARVLEVLAPGPERVTAACPVFGTCGGCAWQHASYAAQLRAKEKVVRDALQRIGGLENATVHPIRGMATPWQYRNKAAVPVRAGRQGERRLAAGYYARGSHRVVDYTDCGLEHPLVTETVEACRQLAETWPLAPYDEGTGGGLLRHIVVRAGVTTGEVLCGLVLNGEGFTGEADFAAALRRRVPALVGVVKNSNPKRGNTILGPRTEPLAGRPYLRDRLGGLLFHISLPSFYQVNPVQTEVLYGLAVEALRLDGDEFVVDAYSGIGTIALFLARRAGRVLGLEIVEQAVADARENAVLNGLEKVSFETAAVEARLPALVREGLRPDALVLDPPRAGVDEAVLRAIAEAGVPRVAYVSCNPATLARDLAVLQTLGYRTEAVTPVDMFPQTPHVEAMAQVVRCF